MNDFRKPHLAGFEVRILKCTFSQSDSTDVGELPNPLAPSADVDPEQDLQRQLRFMQDEIDAFAACPDGPAVGNGPSVHIGIDSEWQFLPDQNRNRVLSFQFHLFSSSGELSGILYPKPDEPGRRIQFEQFLSFILQCAMRHDIIEAWPRLAYIYAHFLRADITHFASFWAIKNKVDGMRGTVTSVTGEYAADWVEEGRRHRPEPLVMRDEYRHARRTFVRFVDTLLLTPGGLGLDAAGELIGVAKLDLPDGYEKGEMARLLAEKPEAFEAYAMRDAEIAVRYGLQVRQFVSDEIGLKGLPPTIGSLAATLCRRLMEEQYGDKDDFLRIFGKERVNKRTYWHEQKNRPQHVEQVRLTAGREYREAFATSSYLGGRNECAWLGPTQIGDFHDYDLVGAYTIGLLDLRELDYEQAYDCRDPQDYVGHVCGFAQVEFAFPESVRYPCLAVRHEERGLYFPRQGVCYGTAPEIALALALGAEVDIKHGFIVPWRDGDMRFMAPFVKRVRERRLHYKSEGRVFEEKLWKEIGNSVYGKTAQGLREKSTFDPRAGRGKTIPASDLTNPYIAAHVTGFIRAVVSEIIARLPDHRKLISVTTDGFLTDAEADEIDTRGPLASRFQALLERVDDGDGSKPSMLERKHRVRQVIAMKTRGQLTAESYPGEEPVLAKAGVKPPMADKAQHNAYMVDLYLNRQPGQLHASKHLISIREQWKTEADLVELQRHQRLNLEFDFKRRPVNPKMIEVLGIEHLACDTVPWRTATEAELARAIFDGWRKKNCLKTLEDFEDWEEFYTVRRLIRKTGIKLTAEGTVGLLRRMFLRAYTQGVWGTEKVFLSYAHLAAWLTDRGYPTSEAEIKNSSRSKLVESVVPATAKVNALLVVLLELQPKLEVEKFLVPQQGCDRM